MSHPWWPVFALLLAVTIALPVEAAGPDAGAAPVRETPVVVAVRTVSPAVVNLNAERIVMHRTDPFYALRSPLFNDRMWRQFFGNLAPRYVQEHVSSLGSGVIIDPDDVIVGQHVAVRVDDHA